MATEEETNRILLTIFEHEYYTQNMKSNLAIILALVTPKNISKNGQDVLQKRISIVKRQIKSFKDFADRAPETKPGNHCQWLANELESDLEKILSLYKNQETV